MQKQPERSEERPVTIGVAGHVDHGKTSLVACLTGVDTDRMKEEKLRGVSIESGIAPWVRAEGLNIDLVDVPGHTDFLKNTVRGLCSVDLAILVVAADDGVMPQTLEHLETLRYFGVKGGFVVLSKADLVDEETLELAGMEIRELVQGTFLMGKKVIAFSARNQRGTSEIKATAMEEARLSLAKDIRGPFRLWIDQARHVNGFGTVVSGTVAQGVLSKDDPILILPSGVTTRARFIESHGVRAERVAAGMRAGVNLHHVALADASRGMLLTDPSNHSLTYLANAELDVRTGGNVPIRSRMKVKVYIGTLVVSAMVVVMEDSRLDPGAKGFVQLRFSGPVPLWPKDRFVISPMNVNRIVGGGYILEIPKEKYTRARWAKIAPGIVALKDNDLEMFVKTSLELAFFKPLKVEDLHARSGLDTEKIRRVLGGLAFENRVVNLNDHGFYLKKHYDARKEDVYSHAKDLLEKGRLKSRVNAREILAALPVPMGEVLMEPLLDDLRKEGKLVKDGGGYSIPDHRNTLSNQDERLAQSLLEFSETSGFVPFSASRFCTENPGLWNEDKAKKMLHFLHNQSKLIRLSNKRFISVSAMETIKQKVTAKIKRDGSVAISDSQDILGYGRTMAVPVFEYLDSVGLTRREGEGRVLAEACEEET